MTAVTGDTGLQSEVLEDLSDARNYRRWLAGLALPHLGEHPLEIGSGLGDYAAEWIEHLPRLTVSEADRARYEHLSTRYAGHPVVSARFLQLPGEGPGPVHSSVVSLNVLEHIPDDVAALRNMASFVQPGGKIVALVPAFPSAMSRFDRMIGHQRRYTRRTMLAAMTGAGLTPEIVRYVNPLGLLTWYLSAKALRMIPRNGPALRLYDRGIVPVARMLDRVRSPFGQSVFAVASV
ncbi:class I SAM-dependent methyltransferase [Longispora albida]|uniref:class I SAM-dependent methyltransferase n=1 Tax=Longispora albida TaxID=203523 RepID=UPI000372FC50|nr:class I SAM-dependent methyltransferase [Longispora albida]